MKKIALTAGMLLLPVISFAADSNLSTLTSMANALQGIVRILIPVVFGLAILVFFWGLVRYIFAGDQDKEKAKKTMLWGVIAIFVMAAIWGIVAFIGDTFGVNVDEGAITPNITLPTVN